MPALQYVKTNDDPSVGDALLQVSQVIQNATQAALRNQLLQIQLHHTEMDIKTAGLNNERLQMLMDQEKQTFPIELRQKQAAASSAETQLGYEQTYGGQLKSQQVAHNQQSFEGGALENQQRQFQVDNQQQVFDQNRQMVAEQLKSAKYGNKDSERKDLIQSEDFQNRAQDKDFLSSLNKSLLSFLPQEASQPISDWLDHYGPHLSQRVLKEGMIAAEKMGHLVNENQQIEAQIEHYKSMEAGQNKQIENKVLIQAMTDPKARALAIATYPNHPMVKAMQDIPVEPETFKTWQQASLWGAEQPDPKIRDAALEARAFTGKPPMITKTEGPFETPVKVPDLAAFEKQKDAIKLLMNEMAKRRDGKTGSAASTTQQAAKPKGEAGTEDNPIPITPRWKNYPPGTVFVKPDGTKFKSPSSW